MATRTITVHDRCTVNGCGRCLHSIVEGERGVCGPCWYKSMPADTKRALNRVISAALKRQPAAETDVALDDALAKLRRDHPDQ